MVSISGRMLEKSTGILEGLDRKITGLRADRSYADTALDYVETALEIYATPHTKENRYDW